MYLGGIGKIPKPRGDLKKVRAVSFRIFVIRELETGTIEVEREGVPILPAKPALRDVALLLISACSILLELRSPRATRGIEPHAYLRVILTRLPTATNWQVKDLTPEAWAQARHPRAWLAAS